MSQRPKAILGYQEYRIGQVRGQDDPLCPLMVMVVTAS